MNNKRNTSNFLKDNWCQIFLLILLASLSYMYVFDAEDLAHMQAVSFGEGIRYAHISYQEWNARIGELASYGIGFQDGSSSYYLQLAYYVMNPLFCTAAILLAIRIAVGSWDFCRKSLLFVFVSLCFLGSKQGCFWFIGNMNWLYPCVLSMLFFVLWEGAFHGIFRVKTSVFLLSIPLAIILGMSNENTAIISVLLFWGTGVYTCYKRRGVYITWQYAVIAALLLISALLFFTAPAGAARAAVVGWKLTFHNILYESILNPINWEYMMIFYWREAIMLGCAVFIARMRGVQLMDRRLALLIFVLLALWGVLFAAPSWGAPRAFTPLDMVMYTIIARILYKILNHESVSSRDVGLIFTLRTVLTLTILIPTVVLAAAQYRVRCQIAERAEAALAQGKTQLVLNPGDLDTSPVMPRFFHIPGCVVAHDISPYVPLIGISRKKYEESPDFTHREWTSFTREGYPSCGDDVLNRGVAKRFGLDSIIYVR